MILLKNTTVAAKAVPVDIMISTRLRPVITEATPTLAPTNTPIVRIRAVRRVISGRRDGGGGAGRGGGDWVGGRWMAMHFSRSRGNRRAAGVQLVLSPAQPEDLPVTQSTFWGGRNRRRPALLPGMG